MSIIIRLRRVVSLWFKAEHHLSTPVLVAEAGLHLWTPEAGLHLWTPVVEEAVNHL
jgi:hypothetical protein